MEAAGVDTLGLLLVVYGFVGMREGVVQLCCLLCFAGSRLTDRGLSAKPGTVPPSHQPLKPPTPPPNPTPHPPPPLTSSPYFSLRDHVDSNLSASPRTELRWSALEIRY